MSLAVADARPAGPIRRLLRRKLAVLGLVVIALVIVGALVASAAEGSAASKYLGLLAVVLASVNIFGGFAVTARMLAMYKKKERPAAAKH